MEGLLQGMERAIGGCKTFHRGDIGAVCLDCKHQAAARRHAINKNGAGAANPMLTADMSTCQLKFAAEEVDEVDPRLCMPKACFAIHMQGDSS